MPKIQYIDGDLLDFPNGINVIGHIANCHATFGAGIALQIKKRYPIAYEVDCGWQKRYKEEGRVQLGTFSRTMVKAGDDNHSDKYIVNLYGQDSYGIDKRQLNYEAIYCAMDSLAQALQKSEKLNGHDIVLGFPYLMGSDRAGGSWQVVEAMIKDIFEPITNIQVIIVKYNK